MSRERYNVTNIETFRDRKMTLEMALFISEHQGVLSSCILQLRTRGRNTYIVYGLCGRVCKESPLKLNYFPWNRHLNDFSSLLYPSWSKVTNGSQSKKNLSYSLTSLSSFKNHCRRFCLFPCFEKISRFFSKIMEQRILFFFTKFL